MEKHKLVVNQHYIPQFILRYWCDDNNKLVKFEYSKRCEDDQIRIINSYKQSGTAGCCYKKFGYEIAEDGSILPNKIELIYGCYESRMAIFYKKLVNQILPQINNNNIVLINQCEKAELKYIIAFLHARSPISQKMIHDKLVPEALPQIKNSPECRQFLNQHCEYEQIIEKYLEKITWSQMLLPMFSNESYVGGTVMRLFFELIAPMNIMFVTSTSQSFCFCDNYVFWQQTNESEQEFVFIPLTPKYGVILGHDDIIPKVARNRLVNIDGEIIHGIMNNMILANINSTYCVYGQNKKSLQYWIDYTKTNTKSS